MDKYLASSVSYAADRGHTICVKVLLKPNGLTEPILSLRHQIGSLLSFAAHKIKNPTLLKYLLTYDARVDDTEVDDNAALINAARTDNVRFAILLLDYNAVHNAVNINQQTPLTTAIMFNNYQVLKLLLKNWKEFSKCARSKISTHSRSRRYKQMLRLSIFLLKPTTLS